MQKQTTLLNFFNRTPKSNSSGSPSTSGSIVNGVSSSGGSDSKNNQNGTPRTPKQNHDSGTSSSMKTPVTPVSSRNGTGAKRRRTSGGQSAEQQSSRKKLRNEDSPTKEYSEGVLVWAKLDGYPWWPAMLRGENRGGPISRKGTMEFHVQFFDDPPTRAWVRKGDLKTYVGSQDANIPPAKSEPGWTTSCEIADEALSMKKDERIKKHWIEFPVDDVGEDDNACSGQSDVEDMEVEPQETPKSRRGEVKKQHKRIRTISSSEEENSEDEKPKGKKDKKKSSRDNEDEYVPSNNASIEESESEESAVESEEVSEAESGPDSDDQKSRRASKSLSTPRNKKGVPQTPKTGGIDRSGIRDRLQQYASSDSPSSSSRPPPRPLENDRESIVWKHMTLTWAKEGQRKDIKGRRETDPDYDPRTLYVPSNFLKDETPGHRQWWEIKSRNFDTILFFKVGKFYEFYHWDACIAAKELGITYMKGDYAHSGFPEIAFSRFANALVEKGYKIARIEQTETPDMLAQRCKGAKLQKHEKIIRREVCQVATKGVRYASFQDVVASNPFGPESSYLYAISEKQSTPGNECPVFGVCFIDTTIGNFHIGQFTDDRHASRLRTLLSHYVPVQILHEKGRLSPILQQLLHNMPSVRKDPLISDSEFWNAKKTLKYLSEQDYFRTSESGAVEWPENFESFLSKNDALGLTPDENWEQGLKCLGGVVWYLKYCLLDHDLLSQKRFEVYTPADITDSNGNNVSELPQRCKGPKYMILDGITIRNLDILNGSQSLLSTIDKCGTPFGKRLLRHWLCLPLAIPEEIAERQDAVEGLMQMRECREKALPLLKSLPDLERILSKIHYLGSAHRSKNHPDGRAFFFEDVKYSRNKISDLLSTLKGFKTCVKIIKEFKSMEDDFNSTFLKYLIQNFPSLDKLLTDFDNAFDHASAAKEGKIKPKKGALEDYDSAVQAVIDIQQEADDYLREVSRDLKARATYFGSDKKRFQIEVPENTKVPREFEMSSSRKGFKRYYNSTTKEFLSSIMKAETEREEILRDVARKIFEKFDKHREIWSRAVECIATLDVLISLSLFSESQEVMCKPVVSASSHPFIRITEGRHPCVPSDTYIPNDTNLGSGTEDENANGSFVILTGPNMGGKSTLMRQVGLLAVLSHVGCFVPAEKCEMSIVDRVFTRLGANDNIGEGESTFFVEMSETSAILKHASANSLLLIDELGRGTATYDGTAIAYAVAKELSSRKCRSLFSTHYHTLVEALQIMPSIQMCHMASMVENENEEDPTQESITFLYKMISGPCPKSYGFNAARLAGISDDVIRVAYSKAKQFESSVTGIRNFTDMCSLIQRKQFSLKDFATLSI